MDGKTIDKYCVLYANNRAHLRILLLDVRGHATVQNPMHAFPNLKVMRISGPHLENWAPVPRSCECTLEALWMRGEASRWDLVFTELNEHT